MRHMMNNFNAILTALQTTSNRAANQAVLLALRCKDAPEHQVRLCEALLARQERSARVALIKAYDAVAPAAQQLIADQGLALFGALGEAVRDEEGAARTNVVALVEKIGHPRLAFLLADALKAHDRATQSAAAQTLLHLIRNHVLSCDAGENGGAAAVPAPGKGGQGVAAQDTEALSRALIEALRLYAMHNQEAVVQAAMEFQREVGCASWQALEKRDTPYHGLVTGALRQGRTASIARLAVLGLQTDLKEAAAAGILAPGSPEFARALFYQAYRWRDSSLAAVVGGLDPRGLLEQIKQFPPDAGVQPGVILALGAMRGGEPWAMRLATALPMMPDPEAVSARLLALHTLINTKSADCARAILRMAADPDVRIARMAARAIMRGKGAAYKACAQKLTETRRPAAETTGRAGTVGAPGIPRPVGRLSPETPVQTPRTNGAAGASAYALAFHLREKLNSADVDDLVGGLKLLGAVDDLAPYRVQIIKLCGHADARVASAAVRQIGRLGDEKCVHLLRAAASNGDPRVRANAVESMAQLHATHESAALLRLLESRHNRERANAIKAISEVNFPLARDSLLTMLTDRDAAHRTSALWVVGQLRLLDVTREIARIARADPNLKARLRAAQLLQRFADDSGGRAFSA